MQPETSTLSEVRRRPRWPRMVLAAYVVALAAIAFWPTPVDSGAGPLLTAITRLIPVLTYDRIEFLANVMLFVPFGALLTLILKRSRYLVVPIAVLATVTIECLQALVLDLRTPSLFDIMANIAGASAGMLAVAAVEALRRGSHRSPIRSQAREPQ